MVVGWQVVRAGGGGKVAGEGRRSEFVGEKGKGRDKEEEKKKNKDFNVQSRLYSALGFS